MLIDFIGAVVLTAVVVVNVNAVISSMPLSRPARFIAAGVVGLWVGLQVALANSGAFASEFARNFPLIGVMVVAPPLLVWVITRLSPDFRRALLEVPAPLLVGLNASRIFGFFFLLLAMQGRLGGPFPTSAGWGDILTGAIALPLAIGLARGTAGRGVLLAWNAFGTADLVVAISLGLLSAEGSPLQLFHDAGGSAAMVFAPWSLIPTVLVPFYLIVHGVIFAQARVPRLARATA